MLIDYQMKSYIIKFHFRNMLCTLCLIRAFELRLLTMPMFYFFAASLLFPTEILIATQYHPSVARTQWLLQFCHSLGNHLHPSVTHISLGVGLGCAQYPLGCVYCCCCLLCRILRHPRGQYSHGWQCFAFCNAWQSSFRHSFCSLGLVGFQN